jgi:pyruvate/2-oxoglutarate dehydrogenase complex dihydrolipoamide dehydrogenase (E3) component
METAKYCHWSRPSPLWFLLCLLAVQVSRTAGWGFSSIFQRRETLSPVDLEYDLVIIGAGASGMFASGASTMLGSKTLLLDLVRNDTSTMSNIGGDCTNAACVPSKAVRSMARKAVQDAASSTLISARKHATETVLKVRSRENPSAIVEGNANLDLVLVSDCRFVSPHEMTLSVCESYSSERSLPNSTTLQIRGKKFLIATGAAPIIPEHLDAAAKRAGLRTYAYRNLLRPSKEEDDQLDSIWRLLEKDDAIKRVVVAGGGATACELGQSLARLGKGRLEIDLVAPTLLPGEDVSLKNAAAQLLHQDGITLHLGRRLEDVLPNKQSRLSDGTLLPPCDALVLCLGRKPALEELCLETADVSWDKILGVVVNPSLQSTTAPHVYACGDCCSAVCSNPQGRTATHAGWTGYYAAANTKLPRWLSVGSKSVHSTVPRVIYTDPELVSVGLSVQECIKKYGSGGYDRLLVPELNTDRADMESLERRTIGFVELRATKIDGRILGFTGCGPAASELANEMSVAIGNRLTVADVARCLHSYPSHGYLLHRVALALTFNSVWGSLEAVGPVGGVLAKVGRFVIKPFTSLKRLSRHVRFKSMREWEALGVSQSILFRQQSDGDLVAPNEGFQLISLLDAYGNTELKEQLLETPGTLNLINGRHPQQIDADAFRTWVSQKPPN